MSTPTGSSSNAAPFVINDATVRIGSNDLNAGSLNNLIVIDVNYASDDGGTITGNTTETLPGNMPVPYGSTETLKAGYCETLGWRIDKPVLSGPAGSQTTLPAGTIIPKERLENNGPSSSNPIVVPMASHGMTFTAIHKQCDGPTKEYDSNSTIKANDKVKIGDEIIYKITYTNTESSPANITITDTLSTGLEYVSKVAGNATKTSTGNTGTITFTDSNVPAKDERTLTYKVKVTSAAQTQVTNGAKVKVGNNPAENLTPLTNQLQGATLTVQHFKEGTTTKLAEDEVTQKTMGEGYTTSPKTIQNYTKVGEGGDPTSGTITKENTVVKYYYRQNQGTVTAHYYIHGTTTKISEDEVQTKNYGETYTTTKKTIPNYEYVTTDGDPTTGTVNKDNTVVNYYYRLKTANITVHHYKEGTTTKLADDETSTQNYGTTYSKSNKTIPNYTYVSAAGDPASGTVDKDNIEIIFYYAPSEGTLTVNHYLENTTTPVAPQEQSAKNYGESYTTSQKTIPNYEYVSTSGDPTSGTINKPSTVVNYYYKLKKATITTHHYLEGTTTKLAEDEIATQDYGTSYNKTNKTIPNYTFTTTAGDPTSGTVNKDNIDIIFYYRPQEGTLTVHHYKQGTTTKLAEDEVSTKTYGSTYTTSSKTIPGYTYVSTDGDSTSGTINKPVTTVNYYYKINKGSITVHHYIEGTTTKLAEDETAEKEFGSSYSYTSKTIPNYTYKRTAGDPASGTVEKEQTEIIFYYRKDPVGEINLRGKKTLTGRRLEENQFSFQLKEGNETLQTKKNDADGNIVFDKINYTKNDIGTHTYKIVELASSSAGYVYDNHTEVITVIVEDTGLDILTVTPTYDSDGVKFANQYKAQGEITLGANKYLEGRVLANEEFSFELRKVDGALLQTKKNAVNGRVEFDAIRYNENDIGKTYTYTIKEVNTTRSGYTNDTHTETVTVSIADNGDGTLTPSITGNQNSVFNNKYKAIGNITLNATKVLNKGTLQGGEFEFELIQNGAVLQKVTNKQNGTIAFAPITYDETDIGNTYTYIIKEKNGGKAQYTYDSHAETVTVKITDNANGTVTATATYDADGAKFTNEYKASGEIAFEGLKTLTGKELASEQFSFDLKKSDGTLLQTKKNRADGRIIFDAIKYNENDIGKTYTYQITERAAGAGYTSDPHTETIQVRITDNHNGTLTATPIYDSDGVKFHNEYKASGTLQLEATKKTEGRALEANQFSFELRKGNTLLQTKKNSANGKVIFDAISYTEADIGKTYAYTIKEKQEAIEGYTNDTHTETISVTIIDNGNGTLTPSITGNENSTFTNIYNAVGTVEITANKVLNKGTLQGGEFEFELREGTRIIQTVANDESGEIEFSPISYTQADAGKTFTYTIREKNGGKDYYVYDVSTRTVKVKVTDNGDGTLKTQITSGENPTFTNTYKAKGSVVLYASKSLTGRELESEQFSFQLKKGSSVLQTKKNRSNGQVEFDAISFDEDDIGKTYTYTIVEKKENKAGYVYDESEREVKITITDNYNGTLKVTATYPNGASFENEYHASGELELGVKKVLTGRALVKDQFSFVLKQGNTTLQTKKNDAAGNLKFDPISYTEADIGKTYIYTIEESNGQAAGYTNDGHVETIGVQIVDNGNGTLTPVVTGNKNSIFTNVYKASGNVTISGSKELSKGTIRGGEFEFYLKEGNDIIQKVYNDENGNIVFSKIEYTEKDAGKTYTYKVVEKNPSKNYYEYDDHTETITVTVVDNGDGTLSATPTYDSTGLKFTNIYKASGEVKFKGIKTLSGRALEANQFEFELKQGNSVLQTKKNELNGDIIFDAIKYNENDIGKTYTYTITEKTTAMAGYTKDTHTETVTVKIEDNYDGTLKVTPTYDTDGIKFANVYRATGTLQLTSTKKLTGRTLANQEFEFELKKSDGTLLQKKKNNAEGKVIFDNLNYTEADINKTYTYTINEVNNERLGYTNDRHTEAISVQIVDNGDGTLTPSITGNKDSIFSNAYNAKGSVTLSILKTLRYGTIRGGEFEFNLMKGTEVLQSMTNTSTGRVTFSPIFYTEEDAGKTFTYTIKEKSSGKWYYSHDTHTETVTVKVVDNGNGSLTVTPTYSNEGKFNNTYSANGSVILKADKTITGRILEDKQFTFQLKDSEGRVLQTKKNALDGSIKFDKINYTEDDIGKTIEYTINEVNEHKPGYTYDEQPRTVRVKVVDNYNGTLDTVVTYVNGNSFENEYHASGSIVFDVDKVLIGRKLANEQFTFELKDLRGNVLQTKKNAANGKVVFDAIEYTEKDINKTYVYTINEVNEEKPGYTYDSHTETLGVTVYDNGDGTLTPALNGGRDIVFNNLYNAKGSVVLSLAKVYNNGTLQGGEFEFTLSDSKGKIQTVANDPEGNIEFSPIEYTEKDAEKTYVYTIKEIKGENKLIDYDETEREGSVLVIDNGDGTLTTEVEWKEENSTFENTRKGKVVIEKQDPDGLALEGSKLAIIDSEGKEIDKWKSTKKSHEVILYAGDYTLVEKESPKGYDVIEPIEFSVGLDGVTIIKENVVEEIIAKDEYTLYQVKVVKEDENGNSLKGAELSLYDKDDNLVDKWVSDGREHEVKLAYGRYRLQEDTTPEGYNTITDAMIEITKTGKVVCKDKQVKVKGETLRVINKEIPKTPAGSPKTGLENNVVYYSIFAALAAVFAGTTYILSSKKMKGTKK